MDLLDEKEVQICIDKIGQKHKKKKKRKRNWASSVAYIFLGQCWVLYLLLHHIEVIYIVECNYHICCGHYPSCIPSEGVFLGSVQSSVGCVCDVCWRHFTTSFKRYQIYGTMGKYFSYMEWTEKSFSSLSFSLATELSNSACLYVIGSILERSWFVHTLKSF